MKHARLANASLLAIVVTATGLITPPRGLRQGTDLMRRAADQAAHPMGIAFEPNLGQADTRVRFMARANGSAVSLMSSGVILSVGHRGFDRAAALGLSFLGARLDPSIQGVGRLPGVSNYYVGADLSAWRTGVPHFGAVLYRSVYPGIDARFYGNPQGWLEYDFHVAPRADPSSIRLGVEGADHLSLDGAGDLVVDVDGVRVTQQAPHLYQIVGGVRRNVAGVFVLSGTAVRFAVGRFDHTLPLVIDPEIEYSTYVGGSGGDWDLQQTIAVDPLGEVFRCGGTDSMDFPVTPGAYQPHLAGSDDAVLFKLNRQGTALVYSTYLGGSGFDGAWGCTIDRRGQLYMVGRTHSSDFPTTPGAFQRTFAGGDASICTEGPGGPPGPCDGVVAKFGRDGRLVYSTYLGGSGDDETSAVKVDGRGDAYVAGVTTSTDFPITGGAFQGQNAGGEDMYIAELTPAGSQVTAGTYLGGSSDDGGDPALGLDSLGNVYAASITGSSDLPTTLGAFQSTLAGGLDGFAVKFNASLSSLFYSTYLGGSSDDAPESNMVVDRAGNVYLDGATGSEDFPVTPGSYQPKIAGGFDAFIVEMDRTGHALVYSTYLGGSGDDFGAGVAVDHLGRRYEMTITNSSDFPTKNAFQPTNAGGFDMAVTQLSRDASRILFSTYLGGSSDEFGTTLALDPAGNIYADGCTLSSDFPTTDGAYQTTFKGGDDFGWCGPSDLFVTKIAFGTRGSAGHIVRGPARGMLRGDQQMLRVPFRARAG